MSLPAWLLVTQRQLTLSNTTASFSAAPQTRFSHEGHLGTRHTSQLPLRCSWLWLNDKCRSQAKKQKQNPIPTLSSLLQQLDSVVRSGRDQVLRARVRQPDGGLWGELSTEQACCSQWLQEHLSLCVSLWLWVLWRPCNLLYPNLISPWFFKENRKFSFFPSSLFPPSFPSSFSSAPLSFPLFLFLPFLVPFFLNVSRMDYPIK